MPFAPPPRLRHGRGAHLGKAGAGKRRLFLVLALAALLGPAVRAHGAPLAVELRNDSTPVLCAEKDNVALSFSSGAVTRARIEAVHPAYMGTLAADRTAPDWTACDMTGDPSFPAPPRTVTLFRSPDAWLLGFTYPSFWRPATVPVRVGEETFTGLHMLQLWLRGPRGPYEVLVLYPPDGYWRARPFAPAHLNEAAYGSSFLVGPVEEDGRPLVALTEAAFDPATRRFSLAFARGGTGTLAVAAIDDTRLALDLSLDRPIVDRPFAALRSMYVTSFNNDVAAAAWKAPGAPGWREAPILDVPGGPVLELWAGRAVPSRHNTSAPDMVFGPFSGP